MEVKTEETTVVTRTYTVTLSAQELNEALVDARKLQNTLRKARNAQIAPASNWATAGYAGHKGRTAKAVEKIVKPRKSKVAESKLIDCPHGCGQTVKERGLKMHEHRCPRYQLHKVAVKAQSAAATD